MDPVPPTTPTTPQIPIKPTKRIDKIVIIGVLVVFGVIIASLLLSGYISLPLSKKQAALPTPTPTPPTFAQRLEVCNVKPQVDPLVIEFEKSGDYFVGALAGNMNELTINGKDSATIKLDSFKTEQSYTFTVPNDSGLFFDHTTQKQTNISGLKRYQVLKVQINCFPNQPAGKKLRIARVDIIQKR